MSRASDLFGATWPSVANQLRAVRKRRGIRQGVLAQAAGVSPETLRRWERGIREPTVEQLGGWLEGLNAETRRQRAEHPRGKST